MSGAGRVGHFLLLAGSLALAGCDRLFVVKGTIRVYPSAVSRLGGPSVVCSGLGGPLETSGLYGHFAPGVAAAPGTTLLCSAPKLEQVFELYESFIAGG
jgi:hypothetical protein